MNWRIILGALVFISLALSVVNMGKIDNLGKELDHLRQKEVADIVTSQVDDMIEGGEKRLREQEKRDSLVQMETEEKLRRMEEVMDEQRREQERIIQQLEKTTADYESRLAEIESRR